LCVHGSPRSYDDQVLCDTPADALEAMVSDRAFSVMVCGHTHVQMMRRLGRRLFVNVGSVGMAFHAPFNGVPPRALPWAEYGVVRWNRGRLEVDLRRVEYELKRFRQAVRQSSMPDPDGWLTQWTA
jgi:diadenosine tetraphosphatase ApaH/serine/threonine PP2A family protein phosphatase